MNPGRRGKEEDIRDGKFGFDNACKRYRVPSSQFTSLYECCSAESLWISGGQKRCRRGTWKMADTSAGFASNVGKTSGAGERRR